MQKNQLLKSLSILSCLTGFTLHASADDGKKDSSVITHSYYVGIETMRYFYKEPDIYQDPEDRDAYWMSETGNFYGFNCSYRMTWKDTLFVQLEGRFLQGKNSYRTGRKDKVNGKTKNKIETILYEPRLITGGIIPLTNKLSLSPYVGIGYRFKSDDSEEVKYIDLRPNVRIDPDDKLGYYRKSNYVYVPLGGFAEYCMNDSWSLSVKGEYDWIVKAWHYTRNSTIMSKSTTNKQENGYGLKGEASISYLYKKVKCSLTPYINYWNIRNSQRSPVGGREPYNITWETGLKLGVTF